MTDFGLGQFHQIVATWKKMTRPGKRYVYIANWKDPRFYSWVNHGKSHYFDWDIFNSYVAVYQRVTINNGENGIYWCILSYLVDQDEFHRSWPQVSAMFGLVKYYPLVMSK